MSDLSIAARCDVLVVGCGPAGMLAAIEAADAGADVLVLESEAERAGSMRLAAGHVTLCETGLQPASREALLADLIESRNGDADPVLLRRYVDTASATHERLADLGVRFATTVQFAHMSRPWAHEMAGGAGGEQIGLALEAALHARGVPIRLATRARQLLRDDDGRIGGVVVESGGERARILARQGVVVASGGFTRNPDLIKTFGAIGSERIVALTAVGCRGDGLLMGLAAGAGTAYIGMGVAPTGPADPETGSGAGVMYAGAIFVNKEGRRFVRESRVYNDLSKAGLLQTDGLMIQIYDAPIKAAYAETMIGKVMNRYVEESAPTLPLLAERLGARCGVDGPALLETVERYNGFVAAGHDADFGRTNLVGTAGMLARIATGPFYAAVTVPGTTHFNGGLRVDGTLRVLDPFGAPIPGLYAAGEVTGGFHGAGYMSGTHLGAALIFGRLAGAAAVS